VWPLCLQILIHKTSPDCIFDTVPICILKTCPDYA